MRRLVCDFVVRMQKSGFSQRCRIEPFLRERVAVSYKQKYVHEVLVNRLF